MRPLLQQHSEEAETTAVIVEGKAAGLSGAEISGLFRLSVATTASSDLTGVGFFFHLESEDPRSPKSRDVVRFVYHTGETGRASENSR